ncbi:MAG: Holliday junction resolvase RuvX [Actinomycetota bacterium]|nr:Holliday junction resolvase RuvX [Actinomycetota bacterium]
MNATVLAIDPGSKRIGIAVSDPSGSMAIPIGTVEAGPSAVAAIEDLVKQKSAVEVIVGLPLHLNSKEGDSAKAARRLAESLERTLDVPVTMVDERLTTVQASRALSAAEVGSKKKRQVVDQVAATFLLQGYLDSRRRS